MEEYILLYGEKYYFKHILISIDYTIGHSTYSIWKALAI